MDIINKPWTCKKGLDARVAPNGAFSTVAECNFFFRLGTCGKVMGRQGEERGRGTQSGRDLSRPSENETSEVLSLILNSAQER